MSLNTGNKQFINLCKQAPGVKMWLGDWLITRQGCLFLNTKSKHYIIQITCHLHPPLFYQRKSSQPLSSCLKPTRLTSCVCLHFRYEGLSTIFPLQHSSQGCSIDRDITLTNITFFILSQKHWATVRFYIFLMICLHF